ncbi:DUF560 domain-containing protein [Xenorhabdus nematophila]|uniref:porin family protein n=1 Tax=Xenorhabdus nematophila TaxID=628 RepID=UPI00054404A1|nr:porin family protein [Xenorhabdus nematophila]CEF32442.1 Outer membrane protein, NilB [Xenorhabdus nematophila str. Websteri]AYA39890.1 DUF560 domain-containing protein [Xenorhabdus nematophila]MBA0018459.1 DUF560 domain-containing protein [Xenorhabdus nematophila]MCB4424793.1 DUF560 domain-containing protein [Xenorhabdus nematophila]QNJ37534.1 DUF560 domain-containing protein [Xenorhabdus nematophila]
MKKIKSIVITVVTTLLIPISNVVIAEEIKPQNQNVYTEDEILRQPRLLENAILFLIHEQNDNLEKVLSLYKKSHSQDPYLILWAEAKILMKKREYHQAINKLEQFVNQYDNPTAKFDLAILYLLNKKYNQSENIFNNLLLTTRNQQDKESINNYIEYIKKKKEIKFNTYFSFKRDSNISKITDKKVYGWDPNKRIKDVGLSFTPRISKKYFFDSGLFSEFDIDAHGIKYLKEKRYDFLSTRIGNKIGFEDYSNYFYLKPFYIKSFYGGGSTSSSKEIGFKPFYDAIGFNLFKLSDINENLKYAIFYENKNEYYNKKKHLNGDINFVSGSLIFIPFNDLYMSLSGSYSVTDRRSKEDSHHDKGMTFLISKRFLDDYLVELNYQKIKTDYIGKTTIYTPAHIFIRDLPPIKIKREDITDSVSLSLSNESINLFGFYPTLSFSYTKNKSSNLFYSYTEKDIFLDFKSNF